MDPPPPLLQSHVQICMCFDGKGPSLAVFHSPVDKMDVQTLCRLVLHSSATIVRVIIMELSEPFLASLLGTIYEKTSIKQLSLKVGPNSFISAPKEQRERAQRRMTANSESGG